MNCPIHPNVAMTQIPVSLRRGTKFVWDCKECLAQAKELRNLKAREKEK